jgi:uncharacterized coiled-coil protein SlyX
VLAQGGGSFVVALSWRARLQASYDLAHETATGLPGTLQDWMADPTCGYLRPTPTRSIAIEAGIGVAATLGIALLSGVPYLGLAVIDPHPVWLVVAVIAARYGTRGLAVVIPVAWGRARRRQRRRRAGAGARDVVPARRVGRARRTVLVGWIASGNGRRERTLAARISELERRVAADTTTIGDLRRAALALRARNDRLDSSLTFLHNIARRLHGSDAEAGAQAALELIAARIGARAASVEMLAGGELRSMAVLGVWNRTAPDRTALAAMNGRQPVRGLELAEGGPDDSDIAAPITDATGTVRGVIAARGVPGGGSSMAALRDLAVIAAWASPVICEAPSELSADTAGEPAAEAAREAGESEPESDESEPTPLTISPANA